MSEFQKAIFAAGCFWGVEARFRQVDGVVDAISGYIGGTTENPTYKEVCTGNTGHAEAVEVIFNPEKVSFTDLTKLFFEMHDPTTLNRQGLDIGTQYRSGIFYLDEEQKNIASVLIEKLNSSHDFSRPIVTELTSALTFYPAEEYHQRYFEKNGGGGCHF